jgi:hypothetical protein
MPDVKYRRWIEEMRNKRRLEMAEEKQNLAPLSPDDLKAVKAGVPYEKPEIIELTAEAVTTCNNGTFCIVGSGSDSCYDGTACIAGSKPIK